MRTICVFQWGISSKIVFAEANPQSAVCGVEPNRQIYCGDWLGWLATDVENRSFIAHATLLIVLPARIINMATPYLYTYSIIGLCPLLFMGVVWCGFVFHRLGLKKV